MARPRALSIPPSAPRLLEVCIHAQPVSMQTKNGRALAAWKERIRIACAPRCMGEIWPMGGPLTLRVTHYCEVAIGDVDNLLKPIQDAMQGIVYLNDRQVGDVSGRRRDINGAFRVRNMSPVLAMAFSDGRPFVHIEIWRTVDTESVA